MSTCALMCGIYVLSLLVSADRYPGHSGIIQRRHGSVIPTRSTNMTVHSPPKLRAPVTTQVSPGDHIRWNLLALIEKSTAAQPRWQFILHIVCSVLCIIGSNCLLFLSMQQAGRLFSQGMWSRKFFRGGGYWLLIGAGFGVLLGMTLGLTLDPYYLSYFISGFMLLGSSVVYIGRRGAILGAVGGLTVGLTLGVIHSGSTSAIIIEGILCMFAGVTIGFIPLFPTLKINSRYIDQGLRAAALSS